MNKLAKLKELVGKGGPTGRRSPVALAAPTPLAPTPATVAPAQPVNNIQESSKLIGNTSSERQPAIPKPVIQPVPQPVTPIRQPVPQPTGLKPGLMLPLSPYKPIGGPATGPAFPMPTKPINEKNRNLPPPTPGQGEVKWYGPGNSAWERDQMIAKGPYNPTTGMYTIPSHLDAIGDMTIPAREVDQATYNAWVTQQKLKDPSGKYGVSIESKQQMPNEISKLRPKPGFNPHHSIRRRMPHNRRSIMRNKVQNEINAYQKIRRERLPQMADQPATYR